MPNPTSSVVPPSAEHSAIAEYEDGVLRPVALATHAWDLHVDSCSLCLVAGNLLCYEGQYLHDDVVEIRVRSTSAAPALVDPRRPLSTIRRRPMPRGAVA